MAKLKAIKKSNKNKVKTIDKKVIKKKVKFNLNQNKEKEMSKSLSDSSDVEKNFDENQSEDGSDDGIDDGIDYIVDHKKSLQSLKEKDPEFYEFLRQNDKQLLDFDDKDSDEDIEDLEEDNDFDEELGSIESGDKLTLKMIDDWSLKLNEKSDLDTIKLVVKWFRNVVNQTSDESSTRIVSSDVFNAIVNLCLIDLLPAIHKFLRLQQIGVKETSNETKMIDPTKSRNWKKVMALMKCYLTDVIKLLDVVSDSLVKATILRHILHLIPFYVTFPHLTKRVLKQTIVLWSESDEKNRVLSFLCILRLMRTQEQPMLSFILKKLYISYVKNCKFTTDSSWPLINFMKQSLVELYSLDQSIAYQHAFVFIKQLAINLRTALTVKKKESYKTVYNWQYLHSILLWSQLLCSLNSSDELKPLICPLVTVIIGTIRLVPSPKFFPLRFHLVKALIKLSDETNTFIPILPLITEVFDHMDNSKKNKTNEQQKQMNFEIMIKVPKLNCSDFEFRNTTINKVYDLILYYLSTQSYRIGFPELVFVSLIKIRKFLKTCHIVKHNQLLKQLLEKIEENSKLINDKRRTVAFSITDTLSINAWERELKEDGTPLLNFYNQRKKIKLENESHDKIFANNSILKKNNISNERVEQKVSEKQDKNIAVKRKSSQSFDEKKNDNKSKKAKKSKKSKKRQNNETKRKPDLFTLNEAFDLSSDECEL